MQVKAKVKKMKMKMKEERWFERSTTASLTKTTAVVAIVDESNEDEAKGKKKLAKDPSEGLFTASESIQIAIHKAVSSINPQSSFWQLNSFNLN